MARTTHVKKAQPRYRTVPVIDPETGQQKKTPVMKRVKDRETGEITYVQKMTRSKPGRPGRPVFMRVTVVDKTQPKPLYTCDHCRKPIEIGTPYKHISPKSGPYGGRKLTRHESCPQWKVWEYSSSWSARIAQATDGFSVSQASSPEEVQDILNGVAESIKELADESRTTAQSMEEGFGHPTSKSEEAEQRGSDLDEWADEIEGVTIPDLPEPEERWYVRGANGGEVGMEDGYDSEEEAQAELDALIEAGERVEADGAEVVADTPEDPSEEQLEDWRSEVEDACSIVYESPV